MHGYQAYLDNDGTSRNQEPPFEERREEDGATTAGDATAEGPVLNEQPRVVPGDLHAATGLGVSARNRRGRAALRNTRQAQAGGHEASDNAGYASVFNTDIVPVLYVRMRRTGGEGSASRGGYVPRWQFMYGPESRTFHHLERHSPEPPVISEAVQQLREFVRAAIRTWPIEE